MASCVDNEDLAGELELVAAMCGEDELRIEAGVGGTCTRLTARLAPLTAGDEERQFVWCELHVDVGQDYPAQPPALSLGGSRGLSDASREQFLAEMRQCVDEFHGEPVLFALLEAGRAALTALNTVEGGECAICLGELCFEDDAQSCSSGRGQVLRLPCYHVFHRQCVMAYCQSEIEKGRAEGCRGTAARSSALCPECRAEIPCTEYPELQQLLAHIDAEEAEPAPSTPTSTQLDDTCAVRPKVLDDNASARSTPHFNERSIGTRQEAFIRLHHLYQGNDEKEKPLLRLLKEFGLDAVVFYGKPALLHIQGDSKDVDSFAGTAKRRHITISIDVSQRSQGPPIPVGVTSIAAAKGSMNGARLKEHLEKRNLGETSFSIIG